MPVSSIPNFQPSVIRMSRMLMRQPQIKTAPLTPIASHPPALRMPRADGGSIPDTPAVPFTGPIPGVGGGRTDDVPMHVPSGSYVIPADVVAHIGDGNSNNGLSVLKMMFLPHPWGGQQGQGGPWGSPMSKGPSGPGVPGPSMPKPEGARIVGFPRFQVGPTAQTNVVRPQQPPPVGSVGSERFGGHVSGIVPATPIMASSGEFVIPPDEVKRRGGGNLNKGHRLLDAWVKDQRNQHIKTLQKLPGPAK